MSKRKYLDAETLKQHLFMEAALGYIKTLADVSRVIDALPEADPQEMASQLWRDAKKDPPAPHGGCRCILCRWLYPDRISV